MSVTLVAAIVSDIITAVKHVHLMSCSDAVNFHSETHAGLFEIGSKNSIDKTDRWKILYAIESKILKFLKKVVSQHERIRSAYTRKNRGIFNCGDDFVGHFLNNLVGVAIGQKPASEPRPAMRYRPEL